MSTKDNSPADGLSDRAIVTTRIIDAPRELVFKAWTEPEHLAQWWGPKGFTNTFQEFDMRPGGTWRFVMHGPDGVDYKNTSVFVEIVEPERIVFQHVSGPRFQVTATFTEQAGKTKLTFQMTRRRHVMNDQHTTDQGRPLGGAPLRHRQLRRCRSSVEVSGWQKNVRQAEDPADRRVVVLLRLERLIPYRR